MTPDAKNFLYTGAIIAVVIVGFIAYFSVSGGGRKSKSTDASGSLDGKQVVLEKYTDVTNSAVELKKDTAKKTKTIDSKNLRLYEAIGVDLIGPDDPPPFTLEDVSGKKRSIGDFKGKVILVNFWATWCEPCRAEIPALERLYQKHKNSGFDIVAINDYESPDKARNFYKKNKMSFTVLIDESGKTSEAYLAQVLPTSYLIDSKGKAVGRFMGGRFWDAPEFDEYLKPYLEEAASAGNKAATVANTATKKKGVAK